MSKLEKFLKESNLSAEAKKVIQEAWNEERETLASEIRLEMKERYSEDLEKLTEGVNSLVSSVITNEMTGLYEEKKKLHQDRKTVRESLGKFYKFSQTILAEQVKDMRGEAKHLNESLGKFMKFSNVILSEEVADFQHEKRELVESRIKLLTEGRKEIANHKRQFSEKAAVASAKYIAETTEKHLSELKTELLEAKQNNFGRQIFEAFGAEFLRNQFNENKVLRGLNESISSKEQELMNVKVQLSEAVNKGKESVQKLKVMEDRYQRKEIMAELTKPLTSMQKQVMESLLSTTPTEKLNEGFAKYHKSVLRGTSSEPAVKQPTKGKPLNEGAVITGNRKPLPTVDSTLDSDDLDFLDQLQKNAGI